jgi:eukaryotic-like serine/threonine-protein kinase
MSEPAGHPVSVHGRYALHQQIASGGMATVHLGRLVGPVGFARTVAIKQLHAQFAKNPEFVRMFIDEARLAARIRHPNVVPTLDVVSTDGELFLVMEYVHGESLAHVVSTLDANHARMPVQIALAIMTGVLYGLHAAHEATTEDGKPLHIIHRDVSPQNIMLGTDGVARVLDFGVAKAAWRAQSTKDGQLKGKVVYMAPEQLLDRGVDRRADIYAASVVLWELLTGKALIDVDNPGAAVVKITSETPFEPPSKYVTKLPRGVDEAVVRGFSKDPAVRFATAREMAVALEKAIFIPTPREIGEWFESTMGERLKQREKLVSEVESSQRIPAEKKVSTIAWGLEAPAAQPAAAPAPPVPGVPDLELPSPRTEVSPKPKMVPAKEFEIEMEALPGPKVPGPRKVPVELMTPTGPEVQGEAKVASEPEVPSAREILTESSILTEPKVVRETGAPASPKAHPEHDLPFAATLPPAAPSKPMTPVAGAATEAPRAKAEDLELDVPVKAPRRAPPPPKIVERAIPLELDQDVLRSVRPSPGMRVARAVDVERVAPGRARRVGWPVVLGLVLAILVGGAIVGVPMYVKRACTAAAARAGITISYEDLRFGWERFTLVAVAATSSDAPGARASMSDVDVELQGLDPVRVVVHNAQLTLEGPDVQPGKVLGRLAGTLIVKTITVDGGHVAWSHPLGRDLGVDVDARDLKGEVVQAAAGGSAHMEALHVSLKSASTELGPWHVTFDRGAATQQLRVDFDPEATMLLAMSGGKLTSFSLDVPTLAAARLGVPPSLFGASRADAIAMSAKARLEDKGGDRLEGKAQLALLGLPAPGFPAPLDVALDLSGAGARGEPIELKEGSLTFGPFKAGVGGALEVADDGAKLSLSFKIGPVPCSAFASPPAGKKPSPKVGGELRAGGAVVVDSRHLAEAHVTIVPLSSCSFGAVPPAK